MKARSHKEILDELDQAQATQFDKLCVFARGCNESGLFRFLYENQLTIDAKSYDAGFVFDSTTVVKMMAREGNNDAVTMLIETFHANPIEAAEGYAMANNVDKVEEFLRKYKAMDVVARGYAFYGDAERVSNMLDRGANIADAVYGAARAGRHELVDALLKRCSNQANAMAMAKTGYAHSGHIELVEDLILRSASIQQRRHDAAHRGLKKLFNHHNSLHHACGHALAGYAGSGYLLEPEKMLKLLSLTKNDDVRKYFTDFIKKNRSHLFDDTVMSLPQMISKAADIRSAMSAAPGMTYADALAAWAPPAKPEPEAVKIEAPAPAAEPVKQEEAVKVEVEAAKPEAEAAKTVEEPAKQEVVQPAPEAKSRNIFGWFKRHEKNPAPTATAAAEAAPVVENKSPALSK